MQDIWTSGNSCHTRREYRAGRQWKPLHKKLQIPLITPKSSAGKISGRQRLNIRNISAVHLPIPLIWTNSPHNNKTKVPQTYFVLKKPVQSFKSDTRGSLPRLVIRRGFFRSSLECPYRNNIQIVYTNFYSFIISAYSENILKEISFEPREIWISLPHRVWS